MTRILVIGDSHLGPLRRGLTQTPDLQIGHDIDFHPFGKGAEAMQPFHVVDADTGAVTTTAPGWNNATITAKGLALTEGQPDVIALSLPLNTSRVVRRPWGRYAPWQVGLRDGEKPLSEAALDAILTADFRHALAFTRDLAALGIPICVVEAPRFFADTPSLKFVRHEVLAHIDARYRMLVRAACEDIGAHVAAQPDATITPEGMTDMAYNHENPEDAHHGNAAFGALMMADLIDLSVRLTDPSETAA